MSITWVFALSTLPNYVRGLDVCLMCYGLMMGVLRLPLKLHEYLAGGKTVVGSDLPSIRYSQE